MACARITAFFFFTIQSCFAFDLLQIIDPPVQQKSNVRYSTGLPHTESLNGNFTVYQTEEMNVSASTRLHWIDSWGTKEERSDLYSIQLGSGTSFQVGEDQTAGVQVMFGSASDKPFKDSSVNTLGITARYSFESYPLSKWIILLNYSNNRPFLNNIPIPGVVYSYHPKEHLRIIVGVPLAAIEWRISEHWHYSLLAFFPFSLKTTLGYRVLPFGQLLVGLDYAQQNYIEHGRSNPDERLFFRETRAFLGFRSPISRKIFAEIETGYSYNRLTFSAQGQWKDRVNETVLDPAWFGRLSLSTSFDL